MTSLYPFYHSTDAIKDELEALATRCQGMEVKSVKARGDNGMERSIDLVSIRAPGASPTNKVFMLFGEHSRELISPESGLHFVKTLCGETDLGPQASDVLKDSEFQIVVNGNPVSRQQVEKGNFCLRTNPNGVDLNRNWDEQWQPEAELDPVDTNPGPRPFSEAETRIFKQLVEAYKPTTFLTIHSGTKGMYMPWAFDMEHLAQRNQPQMMQILKTLDKDHCQCPFGAAGKEVGYSCPGTCLDWVYDHLKTPFAFAFEIYTGSQVAAILRERWQEKMQGAGAFLQEHSHLGHRHFRDFFAEHPSGFVQLSSVHQHATNRMSEAECFGQFNPDSREEYNSVVDNWSSAYLGMAAMVAQDLQGGMLGANSTRTMVVAA
eukprot:CAMPEP_0172891792 /NCGR_PEP_ID=MMETSP1075-20121228/144700_1 /TAXON_ID=2916 /ORGANISM="Ceratium fusus, Strain PA161109" /LENGTH=375 /DNA_ID=CAMNT_0013746307 /DNA_START=69 /DNA_END=1196 /DNA_ORIENTATION=-